MLLSAADSSSQSTSSLYPNSLRMSSSVSHSPTGGTGFTTSGSYSLREACSLPLSCSRYVATRERRWVVVEVVSVWIEIDFTPYPQLSENSYHQFCAPVELFILSFALDARFAEIFFESGLIPCRNIFIKLLKRNKISFSPKLVLY